LHSQEIIIKMFKRLSNGLTSTKSWKPKTKNHI
jgi:hypothetical protein